MDGADYFGQVQLMPDDGFLQPDAGENEKVIDAMDLSDDEKKEEDEEEGSVPLSEQVKNTTVLAFPQAQPPLESNGQGQVRFKADHIPLHFHSVPPNILKGLQANEELMAKLKSSIAMYPCMPLIVHVSPILLLFSGKAVLPKGQERKVVQRAWHDQFTSFSQSAYKLKQLLALLINGAIPFDPTTFGPQHMEQILNEFELQTHMMEQVQDEALDSLYQDAVKPGSNGTYIMQQFMEVLELFSFQYVHLLEYVIYSIAIEPRAPDMPLEAVLTPMTKPSLEACKPEQQKLAVHDVVEFFNFKHQLRKEQEADNASKGIDNSDVLPIVQLTHDSAAQATNVKYKNLIPIRTLYEYFFYLDADGILTKNKWEWSP